MEEVRQRLQHEWIDAILIPKIREKCASIEEELIEDLQLRLTSGWSRIAT